ncbi:aspartate--tRNA ligase [Aggregicoccus sp. 17bor-14]|uniref:aspartate--tRNA ligase n=1 Tax=Myxococcaceae TaxID=31 RepID=UPI00129C8D73|nr:MULTISPECIES: aspartate--tRNA ligase [Myxococcaceae]MBF5045525.1 aspartate--tRNA ligase [Simulacricoccus sp. 17bor-14]MRI91262.1 aspartate--tRNA ligase [Aggregicoccus sp. 17bor-14]
MAVPFISEVKRTHTCGQLTAADVGKEVVLFGWVNSRRDLGGAVFIDLRDRDGITQIVFEPDQAEAHGTAGQLRLEYCIGVQGKVVSRGTQVNKRMKTGEVEVRATAVTIFNRSEPTPLPIEDKITTSEEKRLQYRYLDLRRQPLQQSLMTRSKMNAITRAYMVEQGFLELETPFMGKYTPGGARNFLVPSRLNPGKFYALAESPQLYKQLFMVAGFDRYFQIVKCFRDEDLRVDRQPEFTQIDVEMSFVTQDDIFTIIEGLIKKLWKDVLGVDVPTPFPRMNFDESMAKYGNDKPDLRFGLEHVVLTDLIREHGEAGGVPLMYEAVQKKGIVKAMVVPAEKAMSRAETDKLEDFVKQAGAAGLARAKVGEGGEWTQSPLSKSITPALRQAINQACGAKTGDLLLFQFGRESLVHTVMANLRVHVAKKLGYIPEYGSGGVWNFLWVVNPPLFEYDEETHTWAAAHHAFTRPHDEDVPFLLSDPGRVKCHRYDVVLNGFEIGGGSIRLHDPKVQAEVFKALGIAEEEARQKFGFLLDALKYGAPPHGGIALGMDRLAFLLTNAESLRDVIPFPKTKTGTDQMTGAPGDVDDKQLSDLHVRAVLPPQK